MNLEVGSVLEGRVTGITKFGAFVALGGGKAGMVHISEITHTFVKDIRDHVSDNQIVKVKIINIGEDGKISLSMKQVPQSEDGKPAAQRNAQGEKSQPRNKTKHRPSPANTTPIQIDFEPLRKDQESLTFEEKMSRFKQDSDEKMHDLKKYMESKRGAMSRRGSSGRY
ncbi:MAG: S1 RNA-binding domain-containing protein [Clostridia bacterium]|jgi:S1 RNA binding domain protein|nr:S1 RNA-binding domain-containing protein [Clostridia bacterium]MBQ1375948.1 S1 RNA-binding domain-containing protein [Clostridia bacterium]MBQ1434997.1 S1 RNA-binding domain-containing protein [Clostridia bacterium]MBQ4248939.1 S1 RNA-binding domain-containing protein [Clostridia bacterium]